MLGVCLDFASNVLPLALLRSLSPIMLQDLNLSSARVASDGQLKSHQPALSDGRADGSVATKILHVKHHLTVL